MKYYKVDFTPIDEAKIWLFEFNGDEIVREIGLDKNENTIFSLPDKKYPRGLFGDSPISFNRQDLMEISKKEFEEKWNSKN